MVVSLKNVHISGAKVGIKTTGPVQIDAENITFDNVQTPWETDEHATGVIRGSRITNDPKRSSRKTASSGWTRPNGPPLPVLCPKCQTVFPSDNYVFGGRYWELWDNKEPCPKCKFPEAQLSEGIFSLTKETVKVISAPDITHQMLASLRDIGDALQAGIISPDDAVTRAEDINSGLGPILRKALSAGNTVLMTVFAVIALYLSYAQMQLQKDANASSDAATVQILDALSKLRIQSDGVHQQPLPPQAGHSGAKPAESKAQAKASAPKLPAQRKPKARELRRKAELERRKALSPRHPKGPSCL